jgi:CRP/FNR family transcriptional regulator, cyclic AMP receptor protein
MRAGAAGPARRAGSSQSPATVSAQALGRVVCGDTVRSWELEALLSKLPQELRSLAERGSVRSYRKGTVILQEGDNGDALYILLSGAVKAFSGNDSDRELTLCIDRAGDYFGEMSLDGDVRSASVVTLEPTICAVVTRQMVMEHVTAEPIFAKDLLRRIIARARFATESARRLALLNVYERLVALLDELAQPDAAGHRALPRITHADIASRVGASREMISRLLKDLERGGYVEVQEHVIRLLQPLPKGW